ncbi:hypothetical protein ACLKA6_001134 [Drosophila palustris]
MSLDSLIDLQSDHFSSPEYMEIKANVERNKSQLPDMKVLDNYVYRRSEHASGDAVADDLCWKLWIPVSMVPEVVKHSHEDSLAAHSGINKTLETLRRYFYWPNMVSV